MMLLVVVLIACVSFSDADSTSREMLSRCGEDSVLKCEATPKPGVLYRAVMWYRVSEESPYKRGVLSKRLTNNSIVRIYSGFERPAELLSDDSLDLLLPNVTAQDAGKYLCHLAAPVGEKNVDGHVRLTVSGCTEEALYKDVVFDMIVCMALVLALAACFLCWRYMRDISILRSKIKGPLEQIVKTPLQKKNLKLIYTPGSNGLGPCSYHHVCV
ncbi:CD83 antigen-like [Megalops cyprinoides]|uniref:CD83 antigen-like n=1 Tax=Megalops cyprinoides TaxID=118141 RepID=UPI001863C473|nr:CD83 antigen-like [Megalops cyprinoides]